MKLLIDNETETTLEEVLRDNEGNLDGMENELSNMKVGDILYIGICEIKCIEADADHFEQLANILRPGNIAPTKSVIEGKNGTVGGLSALRQSIDRSKELIASGAECITKSKVILA